MNDPTQGASIELLFPSELGYEKIAREAVAAFARRLGFAQERIEDLKTALCEACINAIEHGNQGVPGLKVAVSCCYSHPRLVIEIYDHGISRYQKHMPPASIESKINGVAPLRGMGLIIITQLVDEACFVECPEGGNRFQLAIYQNLPAVA